MSLNASRDQRAIVGAPGDPHHRLPYDRAAGPADGLRMELGNGNSNQGWEVPQVVTKDMHARESGHIGMRARTTLDESPEALRPGAPRDRPGEGGRQGGAPPAVCALLGQRVRLRPQHRARREGGRRPHPARLPEVDHCDPQVRRPRRPVLGLAAAPGAQRRARPPAPAARHARRGGVCGRCSRRPGEARAARDLHAALDVAARRAAHRRRDAPHRRPDAPGDRRADGAQRELDPRPAPSWPARAAAGAAPLGAARPRRRARAPPYAVPDTGKDATSPAAAPPLAARVRRAPGSRFRSPAWTVPTPSSSRSCMAAVRDVAERGAFTLGDHVEGFERDFASYCETRLRDRRLLRHRGARAGSARARRRSRRRGDRSRQLLHRDSRGGQRRGRDAACDRCRPATRT